MSLIEEYNRSNEINKAYCDLRDADSFLINASSSLKAAAQGLRRVLVNTSITLSENERADITGLLAALDAVQLGKFDEFHAYVARYTNQEQKDLKPKKK